MQRPIQQPLASEAIRFPLPAGILALFSLQQRTLSALIGFALRTKEDFKPAARVIELPWPEPQEGVSETQEYQAELKAALQSRQAARFLTLTARPELESTSYADGYAQGFAAATVIRHPDDINRSLLFDIPMTRGLLAGAAAGLAYLRHQQIRWPREKPRARMSRSRTKPRRRKSDHAAPAATSAVPPPPETASREANQLAATPPHKTQLIQTGAKAVRPPLLLNRVPRRQTDRRPRQRNWRKTPNIAVQTLYPFPTCWYTMPAVPAGNRTRKEKTMTAAELPTITDAQEWQYHARQNAHAAVQLAQHMAIDYGKRLVIHRHPTGELRYEGRGFAQGKEPPCLFYARHVANQALSLERVITRMLEQCGVAPAAAAELIPTVDPETEPPVTPNGRIAGL